MGVTPDDATVTGLAAGVLFVRLVQVSRALSGSPGRTVVLEADVGMCVRRRIAGVAIKGGARRCRRRVADPW